MSPAYIDQFIMNNSSSQSRQRAVFLKVTLLEIFPEYYQYSCQGSEDKPYTIKIFLNDNQIHSTNCSCAYNFSGVCKHTVATLSNLRELMNRETIFKKAKETALKSQQSAIQLTNGLLPIDQIKNLLSNKYIPYSFVEFTQVNRTVVETAVSIWDEENQEFTYEKETDLLHYKCSCSSDQKICNHIILALNEMINVFGATFFQEDYMERYITDFLLDYNLTLDDNYNDLFTFSLTEQGIQVDVKHKNIKPSPSTTFNLFSEKEVELDSPSINQTGANFGLGFCLFANKKESEGFYPVRAKYNKAKTDFSSGFQRIELRDLDEYLLIFNDNKTQELLFKALRISHLINQYENEGSIVFLKQALYLQQVLLPEMEQHLIFFSNTRKSFVRKNLEPLTLIYEPIKLIFKLTETDLFYNVKAQLEIQGKKYNLNAAKVLITPGFVKLEQQLFPLDDAEFSATLKFHALDPESNYLKKDWPNVFKNIIQPLSKKYELQSNLIRKDKKISDSPISLQKQVYISDINDVYISFKPVVKYGEQLIPIYEPELLWAEDAQETLHYKERDLDFEEQLKDEFTSLHPDFEEQDGPFYLAPEQLLENHWLLTASEKMKQLGIAVFGANDLKSFKFNLNKPSISITLKSDIDWFDVEINIRFGDQEVSIKDLQKAFLNKSNYVALDDGTLGVLPEEWMKKFAIYFKTGEVKKNGIQISNYQFGIIDELYASIEDTPAFLEELYLKKIRLQSISTIEEVVVPKSIKAELRDYQLHGLNWLVFLEEHQLGGCLADDMGLGKTLQTIAFLAHLKQKDKKVLPSLIIAPTSLIFNWNAELTKFCPSLKALIFTGPNRMDERDNFSEYDLVISTYGSLLNDIESLKQFHFNYVVLDESQAIKNPDSKRYKAVRLLQSNNRLALTGTPIENNTFDLYAQLNFLNPGLLGNRTHFRKEFSDHIDRDKNVHTAQILSQMISPFILRRTKEQVAKELPEKTESVLYCEMGKEQRKVYDTFKNEYRNYLLNKIDENGVEKSQMYILEGLTKLRQICNSTALISKEENYGNHSAKLELLIEQIKDKTGNHKILVFSQFVKMLHIVKNRFEEEGISYEYLDGKTQNRQENVDNFQNNKDIRVFLISLKAGGTGLNLTEADYVFVIDPWWNPAVENQAIDRCYRIGQTKNVMAYRMICKDTIEEKIVMLQKKKSKVAASIISVDEERKSFDVNQVRELFS